MPDINWSVAIAGFAVGVALRLSVPRLNRWWRRRRYVAQQQALTTAMDPIRLTREQEAIEIARVESAERSQRAAQFCSRYSADLIADGVSPKEAYAEAVAQWNDLNGVG